MLSIGLMLVCLMAVSAAIPPRAGAAVTSGGLSQLATPFNCVGEVVETSEGNGCGTLIHQGTHDVFQVQLSPDGRNAYSVAINGDLIEYSRDPANGVLAVIGCVTAGTDECASENVTKDAVEMGHPSAIAVSPDGENVYVTGTEKHALVEFKRDTGSGLLTLISSGKACISEEAGGECEFKGAKGLDEPYGVTVSPDGENVYVTAVKGEALAEFTRNTAQNTSTEPEVHGTLQPLAGHECIGGPTSGCPMDTAIGMFEPIGVVVSPNGKNVYVGAGADGASGAVVVFEREAGGVLKQLEGTEGCIGSKAISGCTPDPVVQGVEDLAITPDEQNVYATSGLENAVVELKRTGAHGGLTQLAAPNACVTTGTNSECTTASSVGLPRGVVVSPKGEDVYVGSAGEKGVAAFARNSEGALEQLTGAASCVTSNPSGCGGSDGLLGLEEARRVVVSPDGTNLYVAGQKAGAIVELARTVTPTISSVSLDHGSLAGQELVRINGSGFSQDADGVKVSFGGTPSPEVTVTSASTVVAKSPVGAKEETVIVKAENEAGPAAAVPSDHFRYTNKPVVAGVTPGIGSEAGGSVVTITGNELTGASVDFGATPAASITADTAESITATSPPGSGTVNVTVTTANGTSETSPGDEFTYIDGLAKAASGLYLEGYCQNAGYEKVTLERGEVGGPGFAYENWACKEADGAEVLIADTGPGLSMADACQSGSSEVTYAYPEEPNSAYSWGCHAVAPPDQDKGKGEESKNSGGGSENKTENPVPLTKLASELVPAGPLTSPAIVAAVPPPVLAKTGDVAPVSGQVLVELPGTKTLVPLASLQQIPFGTIIEATHGTVSVTSAQPNGTTQTGEFFEGQFILTQERDGQIVATLSGGNFSVCPTARERAHIARASGPLARTAVSGKHVVRKLWANAHGKFSTKGNYAAGAVQGTEWLTEDLCEGTLIEVTRDKVAVTNLVNHKHVEVKTGHHYLAKAP
jgi:DNA-binding beta-propeller fold protein YncE